MFYYAIIDETYLVTSVYSSATAVDNPNYIWITAEQYASSELVGKYYNPITENFDDFREWVCDTTYIQYKRTNANLEEKLDAMDDLIEGKADEVHTHTEYAAAGHNHDTAYATANHAHTGYAAVSHAHAEYSPASHTHTDYASVNHAHTGYAPADHTHTGFVTEATYTSGMSGKANASHTHTAGNVTGLADVATSGDYADLSNKPTIPTTLPANGGNADTVDGKHATDFATASHAHSEYATNEDLSVVTTALNGKANASHTHSDYASNADVSTLQEAVNGKAAASHTHAQSEVTGLATALSGKANASHTHAQGDITGLADALNGKAAASHTHTLDSVTETTNKKIMTAAERTKLGNVAENANNYTHPATHAASMITGLSTVATSGNYNDLSNKPTSMTPTAHTHAQADISGLESVLSGKAPLYATEITQTGEDLNTYEEAGIFVFAQAYTPANIPAGTNGWLIVIPWAEGSHTIKQIWIRHGTVGNNDFETYIRSKVGSNGVWGAWSKYYTTSNPPTAAEVGAISKDIQPTNDTGGVEYSYGSNSGKNVLTEISSMPKGIHTIYAIGGTAGNPETTQSFRYFIHKTDTSIGWIMAYGANGSVYSNYQSAANTFKGWKTIFDPIRKPLWTGSYYMTAGHTATPSKKLSECQHGWLLMWSDYDPDTGEVNNSDFCTTMIPNRNWSGGTWNGAAFYCDCPRYTAGTATDSESRVIKIVNVYDNKLVGNANNSAAPRNDVVLRAIYEF